MKTTKLLVILLSSLFILSGCGTGPTDQEIIIIGSIKSEVQGIASDEYLEVAQYTVEEAKAEHEAVLSGLAQYTQIIYSISEDVDEEYTEQLMPIFHEFLKEFEFEVVNSETNGVNLTITIEYQPFAIGDVLDPVAIPFYDQVPDIGDLTYEEYGAQQDAILFPQLIEALEGYAENIKLSEKMTSEITVTVVDNQWQLNDSYYDEFFISLLDLNLE